MKTVDGSGIGELIGELEALLGAQLESARRGSPPEPEVLEQAGRLVDEIAKSGMRTEPTLANGMHRLESLYRELYLVVAADKTATGEKLKRIHRGRKALRTYGSNA